MCGIVAFVGHRQARPILLEALGRLEYRGYDSAGIALHQGSKLYVQKKAGRIANLVKNCSKKDANGAMAGICHTRWATHGEANDVNAHPHLDQSGKLALVHNGVVENYLEIKERLAEEGHKFKSATDTEIFAHLLGKCYAESTETGNARLLDAVQRCLPQINGTYGIAVLHVDHPDFIIGARRGSPLVLGLGENENFLSSDAAALVGYTQKVIYLKDNDIVSITPHEFNVMANGSGATQVEIEEIEIKAHEADLGSYQHFMLKEIFEQPQAIENAFRGRLDKNANSARLGGLNLSAEELRAIERMVILACGTALHAGMAGERIIEDLAHIPVETDYASEFRYSNSPLDRNVIFFAVSQSGETADTLGALREVHRKGYKCLGVCNNVASSIARESDGGVYMHAGPEVGVAATKSFTSQLMVFNLLALLLGRMKYLSASDGKQMIDAIEALPGQVERILEQSDFIKSVAQRYAQSRSMLFFGRQFNFPVALEGALKMKEISYIHAEGYPSSELKHGVIALVDEDTPSVCIIPQDGLYEKNMNNVQEVKARRGPIIAVATKGDKMISRMTNDVLFVPKTLDCLQPILNIIPLQLLAYHTAIELGRDVDKPRNLAKSVTVE
ncbi:MAG: glutamine--fructose-6-phosphate transaminase (isomerizing) [bacterium]